MRNIILIGPRASGKTETGKIIADDIGAIFIDADRMFEEVHGSIKEFVERLSWEEFRAQETVILRNVCNLTYNRPVILCPGGGAVAHDQGEKYRLENVALLRNFGSMLYLLPYSDISRSANILAQRISNDGTSISSRPALNGAAANVNAVETLMRKRDPLYRAAMDNNILTGEMSPYQVAKYILSIQESG